MYEVYRANTRDAKKAFVCLQDYQYRQVGLSELISEPSIRGSDVWQAQLKKGTFNA